MPKPPIRKAVIPAAGLGTRFLPATKAVPKELLPIVDTPTIQHIVAEAVAAGVRDVILVCARGKDSIVDHFDIAPELEAHLARTGKTALRDQMRAIAKMANLVTVRQQEPLGLGHAVLCATSPSW
jgi:UTP--glucose-1-phosphate uridylyltransferase